MISFALHQYNFAGSAEACKLLLQSYITSISDSPTRRFRRGWELEGDY